MAKMIEQWLTKVKGIPVLENLPPWLAFPGGKRIHVDPYWGSDTGRDGSTPDRALKTLVKAQALATADQNDVVFFHSRSNTAAYCTDYQSSTLSWAKDGVHLIGVNSGASVGVRSRVALISSYVTASNLITVSADNCYIANMSFYEGVAHAQPTGCMSVTGSHNRFENCQIAGIGDTLNDIASAYSLSLTGASENLFKNCTIGYTTHRGAQISAEVYFNPSGGSGTGSGKNTFEDCNFIMGNASSATNHPFVRVAQHGLAAYALFKRCSFLCTAEGDGGLSITYAFVVNADPEGTILLDQCGSAGITDWSDDSGFIWVPLQGAATTGGIGALATKS